MALAEPPLSPSFAHLAAFGFSFCYVASLYVSKNARLLFSRDAKPAENGESRLKEQSERWRDDPDVIRARLTAVISATLLSFSAVIYLLWQFKGADPSKWDVALHDAAVRLGLAPYFNLYPHLITPVLFLGPLYGQYLSRRLPFQYEKNLKQFLAPYIFSWIGVRNYIIAPATEELVFRSCVLSVYQLSGISRTKMILLSPVCFGLAHVHHAWDVYNRHGKTSRAAKLAIFTSTIQFAYTTLFGTYCSYLFLRTGSVYPAITAHSFCNIMGLPEISSELSRFVNKRAAILFAYLLGIVGFVLFLVPWTESPTSLYWQNSTGY